MNLVLFLHLFFLGIWLGCVAVEAVIEIAGTRSITLQLEVAGLHFWIDGLVEIPCFTVVLITGLWMLEAQRFFGWYAAKVILGSLAIGINIICALLVILRNTAARSGNTSEVLRRSRHIFWTFGVGVPCGLAALGIGIHLLGIF